MLDQQIQVTLTEDQLLTIAATLMNACEKWDGIVREADRRGMGQAGFKSVEKSRKISTDIRNAHDALIQQYLTK